MDDHTAATGGAESLDSVVRKYSTIWIWSILCATAGARLIGLGASVLMVSTPLRFGTGNMVDAIQVTAFITSFLSLIAQLVSLWYLYLFFSGCLLPLLFSGTDPADSSGGARFLRGAFVAILCGLAAPIAGSLVGFLLQTSVGRL
ncbi:MAG: hypothetical protein WAJ87_19155 [Bryobacteraceae bacterium]